MDFVGRYINLQASAPRRAAMEARLAEAGLAGRYERFPAADGRALRHPTSKVSPGELGCLVSHLNALAEAGERAVPTHIVEDDVVFTPHTAPILGQILEMALARWDLVFCDIVTPLNFSTLYSLLQLHRQCGLDPQAAPGAAPAVIHYLPLQGAPFAGSASYVVSPASARKLAPLIAAHLDAGPTMPVDHLLQVLCREGRITASVTVPFLTSVRAEDVAGTTIAGREQHQLSALALYLLRDQFYLGRDPKAARALAARLTAALEGTPDMGPFMAAVRFSLSERFEVF
jgi:GR25 family glycosyltransferase involved in LPS biosynthesis